MALEIKQNYKTLDRDKIKYIAIIAMFLGHFSKFVFPNAALTVFLDPISQITKLTMVFFLVEGYFKTSSRQKYISRLFMFAVATQPIYVMLTGKTKQFNILFTFTLCLLMLSLIENKTYDFVRKVLFWVLLLVTSDYCEGTFFSTPVLAIFLYYAYKGKIKKQTAFFWGIFVNACYNLSAIVFAYFYLHRFMKVEAVYFLIAYLAEVLWVAIVLCGKYNGKRSKDRKLFNQWFFYAFYPLQFLIIMVIKEYCH